MPREVFIKLWDAGFGVLNNHPDRVTAVTFLPDGKLLETVPHKVIPYFSYEANRLSQSVRDLIGA